MLFPVNKRAAPCAVAMPASSVDSRQEIIKQSADPDTTTASTATVRFAAGTTEREETSQPLSSRKKVTAKDSDWCVVESKEVLKLEETPATVYTSRSKIGGGDEEGYTWVSRRNRKEKLDGHKVVKELKEDGEKGWCVV